MGSSDLASLTSTWHNVTAPGLKPEDRRSAARDLAFAVKKEGPKLPEEFDLFEKVKSAIDDTAAPERRLGALIFVLEMVDFTGQTYEPQVISLLLPSILERTGDKQSEVKEIAEKAANAIVARICPHAVKIVLPVLFEAIRNRKNWKAQEASLQLLGQLSNTGPRQLAACMHLIVPLLAEQMNDGKKEVMKAAFKSLRACAACIGNRDIEAHISLLVSSMVKLDTVPDCISTLSGVTFVQQVISAALSIMVPVLIRGMKDRATLVKRKTVVVIDNVLRLVEDPREAGPFLPQLIPGVERVSEEVSDPECRVTAGKILNRLRDMKREVEERDKEKEATMHLLLSSSLDSVRTDQGQQKSTEGGNISQQMKGLELGGGAIGGGAAGQGKANGKATNGVSKGPNAMNNKSSSSVANALFDSLGDLGISSEAVGLLLRHLRGSLASAAREEAEKGSGVEGKGESLFLRSLKYVSCMCAELAMNECLEEQEWAKCSVPYLSPFLSPFGEDPETVSRNFLGKVSTALRGGAENEDDGNDTSDGEMEEEGDEERRKESVPRRKKICDCVFSLGYGGKILLNSARLCVKRGRRYGLCGHNGCGKSTLMRAIAAGKLDNFPSPDELRTIYVEHDLDSSLVEFSPVAYLVREVESLRGEGREGREKAMRKLEEIGFTSEMIDQPICALSGGWKMKLALVRAMLMGADMLLLDEPTNHLDVNTIDWLVQYLTSLRSVSCLIVSHDSSFLDRVCTDIIHYEKRKLRKYKGNLSEFVKVKPEAKVYYDLQSTAFSFKFPTPGQLDGIKRKESPILKLTDVRFVYPDCQKPSLVNVNVQCGLGSRVGVVGANGAGKSTLIKILTAEMRASSGIVWRHPNLGMAYVAQHAFHHLEQHLEKTPNEYIRWRFARGEDREELAKVHRKVGKDELKKMEELIMHKGEKKQLEKLLARRKSKKSFEYEVKWVGLKDVFNSWLSRELLEDLGFEKLVHDVDAKEVARLGVYGRPLTIASVQEHFDHFGLDSEFGTYGQIGNLSGGQKVKVVLAAAMWSNPHMIVLDEPTNFLDRDSLGALVGALRDFEGAVVVISHNKEFLSSVTNETWSVASGVVTAPGNPAYEKSLRASKK